MDPVPAGRLRPGIGGIERERCEVTRISGTAVITKTLRPCYTVVWMPNRPRKCPHYYSVGTQLEPTNNI